MAIRGSTRDLPTNRMGKARRSDRPSTRRPLSTTRPRALFDGRMWHRQHPHESDDARESSRVGIRLRSLCSNFEQQGRRCARKLQGRHPPLRFHLHAAKQPPGKAEFPRGHALCRSAKLDQPGTLSKPRKDRATKTGAAAFAMTFDPQRMRQALQSQSRHPLPCKQREPTGPVSTKRSVLSGRHARRG